MKYLTFFLLLLASFDLWGNCPEFQRALERSMAKALGEKEQSALVHWSGKEAQDYKSLYSKAPSLESENRTFIQQMELDKSAKGKSQVLYFDVENSVQKKLNDSVIGDKAMVDSINNSFMEKFHKNLAATSGLKERLQGQYKDYKSLRLRLELKPGDSEVMWQEKLSEVYRKTNLEFSSEFEKMGLTKLIAPRTDEVVDVKSWFLSGVGDSALEANMAARGARRAGLGDGSARTMSFKEQVDSMYGDVKAIEELRKSLANDSSLLASGIMAKSADGVVLPSKEMIGVLRKIRPADCESAADYTAKIQAKTKTLFGTELNEKAIDELTNYFQKVDSVSPPLFQRERVAIDLAEAKGGIVSVDFTGVGVDNAYEQMRALSAMKPGAGDKKLIIQETFTNIQANVDGVTEEMNQAKRTFSQASKSAGEKSVAPKFSGDDGILMPEKDWDLGQKKKLIKELANSSDPSKYRVTFVKTEFNTGGELPAALRSQRVVRAEGIEKELREAIVGKGKISAEAAKKMIFAIDGLPAQKGGQYNLIIGGQKPTEEERKLIMKAFEKVLQPKNGEVLGQMIEAYP